MTDLPSSILRAFPDRWVYVWLDEDGVSISPRHDTFAKAVRWAARWRPTKPNGASDETRRRYLPATANGSLKPPAELIKVHIVHERADLDEKQRITIEAVLDGMEEEVGG